MKLNVFALGLAFGLIWGLGLFILTWWIIAFDGFEEAAQIDTIISRVYRGYSITAAGSVIGLIWAFFDGLIGGVIFAWLYNLLAGRLTRGGAAQ